MRLLAMAFNGFILAFCTYLYGVHVGQNMDKPVDMQMQIRYAVAQAMIEGQ
jgi:hypothetical protein